MDAETQKKLREKFEVKQIGLKPKITCRACSKAPYRECGEHKKQMCRDCGQWITPKHMHVEFVGHANVTDRLLEVDPGWTWEPVGFDERGLPALDANGGLWIRLTVAGVTRIGYGGADGKEGDDAVKEAISDAIKVTAMRFGVGLDLWRKEEASGKPSDDTSAPQRPSQGQQNGTPQSAADREREALLTVCRENGIPPARVADRFRQQYDAELGAEQNANRLKAFRKLVEASPEAFKVAAGNGATQQ